MADPYRITDDWVDGYKAGFESGYEKALRHMSADYQNISGHVGGRQVRKATKKVRKQSGKAKILTAMTAPVWKKYKKGSGKKTYVQIRAQVSRSQAYKRKVKKL